MSVPTPPLLDVIIPVYNAATTLVRAVESALTQPLVHKIWLVDDGSQDGSVALAQTLATQYPERIVCEALPHNRGAAVARNWGALCSPQTLLAFLDADDAYAPHALEAAAYAMHFNPQLGMVRLALHPIGLPEIYRTHAGFAKAWRSMEMTGAGNTVWRRSVLLAAGGFPQDALFRQLGGEDGALGFGLHQQVPCGTLFDEPGVYHYFSTQADKPSHAERLLRAHLLGELPASITPEAMAQAEAVSARIQAQLANLRNILTTPDKTTVPLHVQRA